MLVGSINWTLVLVALAGNLAAIIAAIFSGLTHRAVRTPSGTPIGQQVEDSRHVALGNNYRLQRLTGEIGDDAPRRAMAHEAKVDDPQQPPASE